MIKLTKEVADTILFLYQNKTVSLAEIGKKIGVHKCTVSKFLRKRGLCKITRKKKWTLKHERFLIDNFQKYTIAEFTNFLPYSHRAIMSKTHQLGLKKEHNRGQFKKGNVPFNKGKPHKHGNSGQFRKGLTPKNTKALGEITWRESAKCYFFKTEKGMIPYSRYLWETHKGEIALNHVVTYIDGNPKNCVLENLELIHRKELVRRNAKPQKAAETLKRRNIVKKIYDTHIKKLPNTQIKKLQNL
jgi:HNH endonuclease